MYCYVLFNYTERHGVSNLRQLTSYFKWTTQKALKFCIIITGPLWGKSTDNQRPLHNETSYTKIFPCCDGLLLRLRATFHVHAGGSRLSVSGQLPKPDVCLILKCGKYPSALQRWLSNKLLYGRLTVICPSNHNSDLSMQCFRQSFSCNP